MELKLQVKRVHALSKTDSLVHVHNAPEWLRETRSSVTVLLKFETLNTLTDSIRHFVHIVVVHITRIFTYLDLILIVLLQVSYLRRRELIAKNIK